MIENMKNKNPVLEEIVCRLIKVYDPEEIYLFGSMARGEAGEDSDYDLLIIVPDDAPQEKRKDATAYKALRGTGVAVDVIVWTRSAFDKRLHLKASLPSIVKEEGRLLYAA
jgi:predicted nucleotidyltransferase